MDKIKKFESFNNSSNLSKSYYYSCDECSNLWDTSEEQHICLNCDSEEIEELSKSEYNLLKIK